VNASQGSRPRLKGAKNKYIKFDYSLKKFLQINIEQKSKNE
jgi:hypothetical protein